MLLLFVTTFFFRVLQLWKTNIFLIDSGRGVRKKSEITESVSNKSENAENEAVSVCTFLDVLGLPTWDGHKLTKTHMKQTEIR